MYQVEKTNYQSIIKLLKKEQSDHTFSYSVLENKVNGEVYVDNIEAPKTALIEVFNGLLHIFGGSTNIETNNQLYHLLKNKAENNQKPMVLFTNKVWESVTDDWELFKNKEMRYTFTFDKDSFLQKPEKQVEGYKVREIDREMIERSDQYPEKFYKLYWESVDNFLENGFGFSIVNEAGQIVSEATTVAVGGGYFDFDIFTNEDYRGKGLGKMMSRAIIEYGLNQGMLPNWECFTSNQASIKTAESIGFKIANEHPFYIL